MAARTHRPRRRTEALSRERITEAAVELLDTAGESGLTFRALTERLATGAGAIYWHVANKGELLRAATDAVIVTALATPPAGAAPRDRVRAVALGLFDAVEAHPWVAAQLSALPYQSTAPRIFESVGQQVKALGVPEEHWFATASALVEYILGAAGQNAANTATARALGPAPDRGEILGSVARAWEGLDAEEYPFTRAVGDQLRAHDDREQFLAGIDLILAGVTALHLQDGPRTPREH
ncbi:TetR/AcrR family transcriptional regulator [Streptomyces sp. NPDC050560]|uniref:TetR/AcrR family transcriptional regulator n=1 Tax=Streptomyces sp. NPDC050560 TaxID=3365630 RepID=UPI0037B6ACF0